jgi:hypothetical protein
MGIPPEGGIYMTYEITLSEQEYAALGRCRSGQARTDPEQFLHDMIHHLQTSTQGRLPLTAGEIAERQYHEGKITHIRQDDPQRRQNAKRVNSAPTFCRREAGL